MYSVYKSVFRQVHGIVAISCTLFNKSILQLLISVNKIIYEKISICACRLCIYAGFFATIRLSAHPKKPYLCKIAVSLLVYLFTLNTQA